MQLPTALEQPAATAGCATTQPDPPFSGLATPRVVGELVATHGSGPSTPRCGAPFSVALRIGGTLCPAPCYGETTSALGQSSLGCCPCGAPIYGAASVVLCCVVLCCVVLCCVVLCCVVLCCVVLCCVVLCCVVLCCVVLCGAALCRRRCYQKAMAKMSTHG